MLRKHSRTLLIVCLASLLSSSAFAERVKPVDVWSGKIRDDSLRKLAPRSGFIADAGTWKKLWTAWRPDQKGPEVDFDKELVLVGTVPGPNLVLMRPTLSDDGNLRYILAGTKIAGPGFGYKLLRISSAGVTSVNGTPLNGKNGKKNGNGEKNGEIKDSITVRVVGTLRTGIVAIGGETTGVTITAKGITWELDLGKNPRLRKLARKLHMKRVIVQGSLERRKGVEIKQRWIVTVTGLRPAGKPQPKP